MATLDINRAVVSEQRNAIEDWEVTPLNTDGVSGSGETKWTNTGWQKYWGYFNSIPDLKSAILLRSIWNCGRGYTTDADTQAILDHIKGWGKDTFEDILYNMDVIAQVNGDSYSEIVTDPETKRLLNLLPRDPSSVTHIVNDKGRIVRYEIVAKGKNNTVIQPEDMFHLSNDRLADQVHGISVIKGEEDVIKADQESFVEMKKIIRRQARPMIMFKINTDDQTKTNEFKRKYEEAKKFGEDLIIPDDENTISHEVVNVTVSDIVMQWREALRNTFYRTVGLPQIVPGAGGQSTESESKVIYLAFENIVEHRQRFIERQIVEQLGLNIDLVPPTSMSPQLQQDTAKDAGGFTQPSDIQAGVGR